MKHQRARSDTTSCVSKGAGRAHNNVHGTTAQRCARYFFDRVEISMAQGFSRCSVFPAIAASKANAQHACACRSPRNRVLSIPSDLCKKSSVDGPINLLASTRSGSNRANRPASDSLKDERERMRRGGERANSVSLFLVRPSNARSRFQSPSLVLSSSFTAFGLALPSVAFIT
jgi:hypothetical protein